MNERRIRVGYRPSDDGYGWLEMVVSADSFRGEIGLRSHPGAFTDFARALAPFPLDPAPLPEVEIGYGGQTPQVSIRIEPAGSKGELNMSVSLFDGSETLNRVSMIVPVTSGWLQQFAAALRPLIDEPHEELDLPIY